MKDSPQDVSTLKEDLAALGFPQQLIDDLIKNPPSEETGSNPMEQSVNPLPAVTLEISDGFPTQMRAVFIRNNSNRTVTAACEATADGPPRPIRRTIGAGLRAHIGYTCITSPGTSLCSVHIHYTQPWVV